MKVINTAHVDIDCFNLFIIETEICCSSFSSQFKFSCKTRVLNSRGEIFGLILLLSMPETDKTALVGITYISLFTTVTEKPWQLIFFTI
jgi:hypothetical protein